MMNMGKPDSIPQLNEQMAIELGANLLGETIVFVSAATIVLMEYSRQVRKEMTKDAIRLEEKEQLCCEIRDLKFKTEYQDAKIRRLEHAYAELEMAVLMKPWRGKSSKDQPAVTENETSSILSKNAPTDDKNDCKGR